MLYTVIVGMFVYQNVFGNNLKILYKTGCMYNNSSSGYFGFVSVLLDATQDFVVVYISILHPRPFSYGVLFFTLSVISGGSVRFPSGIAG